MWSDVIWFLKLFDNSRGLFCSIMVIFITGMLCLFLMNVVATFIFSISKRSKCSSLISGWKQCPINTYMSSSFSYIKSYYQGIQFWKTFDTHEDERLVKHLFCLVWSGFPVLSAFHVKKAFPNNPNKLFLPCHTMMTQ